MLAVLDFHTCKHIWLLAWTTQNDGIASGEVVVIHGLALDKTDAPLHAVLHKSH